MIDVLMSVRNAEKYLSQSIQSILNQTCRDFTFYIIDDASHDNSVQIIKSFPDPRIIFFQNQKPQGLTKNLNFLLKEGKGKFIARQDADDVSVNNRLEKELSYLENNKLDIVGSDACLINEKGVVVGNLEYRGHDIRRDLFKKNIFIHSTILMRREIFRKLRAYSLSYPFNEDYDLWMRAVASGYQLEIIREKLINFRVHENSVSLKNLKQQQKVGLKVRLFYLKKGTYPWYDLIYLAPTFLSFLLPVKINRDIHRQIFHYTR